MITIYGFAPSTYTRTARLACLEKGVAHELAPLAYREPSHFERHPFGKMPAMRHGERTLFETLAIVAYVEEAFDGPSLFGSDRVETLQWMSAISDYAYEAVVGAFAKQAGDVAAARAALAPVDAGARFLDAPGPNAAGLLLAPMLAFALASDASLLEGLSRMTKWWKAMEKRPSMEATK